MTHREATADWGIECMRYEIRDIQVPAGVRAAMELQVRASAPSFGSSTCVGGARFPWDVSPHVLVVFRSLG